MNTILITGGSGLVGRQLTQLLQSTGYEVAWLTRKPNPSIHLTQYEWDYKKKTINPQAISRADAIIHLAGANINGKRWSSEYKKEIYDSRVKSTDFLFDVFMTRSNQLKAFVAASGTGYYGCMSSEKIFKEIDLPGTDFLAKTSYDWEKSSSRFSEAGIRTVIIRSAVVLSKESSALKKISLPVRFRIGPLIGNGNQYFPWIHLDDLCKFYLKAVSDESISGLYNAVAPEHLTYQQLIKYISNRFNKSLLVFRIPPAIVKIILGEIANSILHGSRISSDKIIKSGFQFTYPTMESALVQLFPEH